jgi:hypothetical protein
MVPLFFILFLHALLLYILEVQICVLYRLFSNTITVDVTQVYAFGFSCRLAVPPSLR